SSDIAGHLSEFVPKTDGFSEFKPATSKGAEDDLTGFGPGLYHSHGFSDWHSSHKMNTLPGWIGFIPIVMIYCSVVLTWIIRRVTRDTPQTETILAHHPDYAHSSDQHADLADSTDHQYSEQIDSTDQYSDQIGGTDKYSDQIDSTDHQHSDHVDCSDPQHWKQKTE
ncbi:hypothetical protein OTU49_005565, partial [Cherax quadricarinatus]